jgi:MoxR-like ATPase
MATPAAFVGREDELSRLLAALANQTRMVLVVGDAGVGKTCSQKRTEPGRRPGSGS